MSDEALTVLRDIWHAHARSVDELEEMFGRHGHGKACKAMKHINFAGADEKPVDDDLRAAWKATLERDGKIRPDGQTVADLLGEQPQRRS